ncbi:purine nucleoside phosphorylase I, inosine and guanosine-specific [Oribacterium asaccharolyticum ACB7]|uniref:Purine nucleoside phosphorylase n=1 Tax=Oribacterium asaccharolyticum ACB7 TaxID=796944 RepID=G9WVS5_9FIRM|nr:purine-nucleoside phosphorylase [Oribacterium asaccharolyticum]EHL10862.1 purine nucleoside phosphorylase I, inosine and guanosine-specific [Oribacterium asaccharolyticum ACB7]
MTKVYERLQRCYKSIEDKIPFRPRLALVLGSGLGDYAERIEIEASIDYHEITDFPVSTVSGHKGRFVFGHIGIVPVVIMQGRVHFYEGYSIEEVVLPERLMHLMGAEILFLTNACGSANPAYQAGDFMLLTDHILYSVPNPLIGANAEELGVRFPDMSEVYDEALRKEIFACAKDLGISLREGVYMQFSGPSFETPAEVRMAHILGADAVGMSTACEAVAGRHCGMRICGISCISNLGAGLSEEPLSDEDVKVVANRVAPLFKKLVTEAILRIGRE